ncbi:peptidase M20A family protein [Abortiporus biennis]
MSTEKGSQALADLQPFNKSPSRLHKLSRYLLSISILFFLSGVFLQVSKLYPSQPTLPWTRHLSPKPADLCPQVPPITSKLHKQLLNVLEKEYADGTFKKQAYETLGGAVRIPTVTYDDLKPPGQDSRWDIYDDFHAYLEQKFPLFHSTLKKTNVNKYALVYHWQGSDPALKPILLTAHQDVVPVDPNTVDEWLHPPFSGYYDGKWIWGRGSCDDKSGLIGSFLSIETLLSKGFQPARTIVLAYGIDEERGGISGASAIRDYLLTTYGEDSFSILIDEGGGLEIRDDIIIATPSVAEKGHFDLRLEVSTPGGHSSVPPDHTSIGILAAAIVELEANPFIPHLYRDATYYTNLQCQAAYDSDLDQGLRKLIEKSLTNDRALSHLEDEVFKNPLYKAMGGTTQAADIIGGGVKVNALPEEAFAIVNHRIATHSSVADVKMHISSLLIPLTSKYNLSLNAFGEELHPTIKQSTNGRIKLSDAWGTALEPAPITPTVGSPAYQFLSGTILSTAKSSARSNHTDKLIIVAPGIPTGNTDTRYYWSLTRNIFRYRHRNKFDAYNGAHTVNEALLAEGFIEVLRFFTRVILNADETDLLDL